jgi:hypothetical protein
VDWTDLGEYLSSVPGPEVLDKKAIDSLSGLCQGGLGLCEKRRAGSILKIDI